MTPLRWTRSRLRAQQGSALPLALLTMLLLSVLGFALVTVGMSETVISGNWRSYSAAFYAADAGIESGIVGLRNLLSNTATPTTAQLNGITAPTLNSTAVTFLAYSVAANGPAYTATMPAGPDGGLSGTLTDYLITSTVQGPNGTKASLSQIYHVVRIPLFQFAIFYGRGVDLEISPGADMTITGKVFANSNLFLSPQAGTLQMDSLVASAGNIYRTIKRSGSPPVEGYGGNPQIKDASGNFQTLNFDHVDNQNFGSSWTAAQWQAAAQSTFGGMVKDSSMGVTQIVPPIPTLFYNPANPDQVAHQMIELPQGVDSPALAAAKLYSQASLIINNGVATTAGGGSVTLPSGTITTTSFYDSREGQMMQTTQVDVGKLSSWISGAGSSFNGVVYIASTLNSFGPSTPCSTNQAAACPAVRLVNGAALPGPSAGNATGGLTVVSQNPVYIQGDYNTALTGSGGSNHPPAAVLADAVTVLSNNWSDGNAVNSGTTLSGRTATTTTVNAAIATGPSVESASGAGNGQLENDIRLLENWSGQTLNYAGSLIDLWHSEQVTKPWQNTGVYYNAPHRNWSYDPLFNATPPPGTPTGTLLVRGQWSRK
jgi:hypothetical protein